MDKARINIVAVCGSVRAVSANLDILKFIEKVLPINVGFTIYEGLAELPHFNPDFSPIELRWSKVKAYLKKVKARTQTGLEKAIAGALKTITASDCINWFRHCGSQVTHN